MICYYFTCVCVCVCMCVCVEEAISLSPHSSKSLSNLILKVCWFHATGTQWKWSLKGWEGVLHIQEPVHPSLPSFLHNFFHDWWIMTSWQSVESPLPASTCVRVAHRPFNRVHICPQPSPPTRFPNPSRCAAVLVPMGKRNYSRV